MKLRSNRSGGLALPRVGAHLAAALLALVVCAPAAAGPAGPALFVVRQPGKDLGNVRQNETVRFPVRLENVSQNEIRIVEANTSCTCLTMKLPVTLAAGETRDVDALLETEEHEGTLVARIRLAVDQSPDTPKVDIWANCNVVPEFKLGSPGITMLGVPAGEEAREVLRVEPVAAKDARITAARLDTPYFSVEAPAPDQPGPWDLRVIARGDLCQGEFRSILSVTTTSTRIPEIRVPVVCRVNGGYRLSAEQAMLGIKEYERAKEARAVVAVSRADGRPLTVKRIEPSTGYLATRCETLGQAREEHSVEVGVDLVIGRPPSNTLINEYVTLEDDAGKPMVRIPVTALLRSGEPCCSPATPEARARERAALEKGFPPYFRTEDADGNTVDNEAFMGKPSILLFFCGCPACHAVCVGLVKEKYEPFGLFGFLHWAPQEARGFIERTGFPGRLVMDTGARIGERFGVASCPYLIVLDGRGRIVHRRLVYLDPAAQVLKEARQALEKAQQTAAQPAGK